MHGADIIGSMHIDHPPSLQTNPYEGVVPVGERVLIDDRPHIAFVFTQMWGWILAGVLIWGAMRWVGIGFNQPMVVGASNVVLLVVGVRFVLGLIDWIVRRHILTDARIIARFGILRTVRVDIPLRRVQHTMMVRPLPERLMGIGSLGITSAGTGSVDLVWRGMEHPQRVLDQIREQVERVSAGARRVQSVQMDGHLSETRASVTPVIGIVGGIGSGKSTVAGAFERLGCVVSDSDQSVREIMRDPQVIAQMVEWWGREILIKGGAEDGAVDRTKVAKIVFEQPFDRRRLEGLIHPMVHDLRRSVVERAIREGAQGVILDAPLLFEAGVDAECDAVVFVDTPLETRVSRVESTRGWSREELEKREKAQLGLEQKQKRSDYTVANDGLPDELQGRVARVLASIRRDLQSRHSDA